MRTPAVSGAALPVQVQLANSPVCAQRRPIL